MPQRSPHIRRIPAWLKIGFTVWMLVWVPAYLDFYGPQNFLWLCDFCNFIILLALWTESGLFFSSQIVSVLVIDILWSIDISSRFLLGCHPIGGTEYMFNPDIPLYIRLFSLFHFFNLVILAYTMIRLGYDRRGLILQTAFTWILLPLSYFFTDPERNINWIWGLFGKPQTMIAPWVYLLICMIAYPLVIYLPCHWLMILCCRWQRQFTRT